jgi:hypothetical protein
MERIRLAGLAQLRLGWLGGALRSKSMRATETKGGRLPGRGGPEDARESPLASQALSSEEEHEYGFVVTEEDKALLLESLEQARRGETVDGWKLLYELRERLREEPQPARR